MESKEFKGNLKKLGFKVVKCKFVKSWNAAQYVHIDSGELLNHNVFNIETLAKWAPLFDFLRSLTLEQKEELKEALGYRGLFSC